MDAVARFIKHAEAFECWARSDTSSGSIAARNALLNLSNLYSSGLQLPEVQPSNHKEQIEVRVDQDGWDMILERCKRLPFDYYSEVFNPFPVPAEEPVTGSLADDIADIYRDVVSSLMWYRKGYQDEAIWQWTFDLSAHWGEHATSAIRALHCWLSQNSPDHFSVPGGRGGGSATPRNKSS